MCYTPRWLLEAKIWKSITCNALSLARCLSHILSNRMKGSVFLSLFPPAGISRLKGTAAYELFLVYQQRALNWNKAKTRSKSDILAALNVRHQTVKLHLHQWKKSIVFSDCHGFPSAEPVAAAVRARIPGRGEAEGASQGGG